MVGCTSTVTRCSVHDESVAGKSVKCPPLFGVIAGKCRRSKVAISCTSQRSATATTQASVAPSRIAAAVRTSFDMRMPSHRFSSTATFKG